MSGTLVLIGTPIGNLGDISSRVRETLSSVDVLACEDTRRTRKIYAHFEMARPRVMFSCHDHNEDSAVRKIVGHLTAGLRVGLVTDAGMPGISDPGYQAVRSAVDGGFSIEVIPGPSAVATAIAVSGLPASSFVFKGFPPRKPGKRRRFLEQDKDAAHTIVLFEAPHRLHAFLVDALDVLGDRRAAVCVELTKLYEEIVREPLSDLCTRFEKETPRGEVTVVIDGVSRKAVRKTQRHQST